jgi:hypothetical protein
VKLSISSNFVSFQIAYDVNGLNGARAVFWWFNGQLPGSCSCC